MNCFSPKLRNCPEMTLKASRFGSTQRVRLMTDVPSKIAVLLWPQEKDCVVCLSATISAISTWCRRSTAH